MKKLLKLSFILLAATFFFSSCWDEFRLASDLEGKWNVTSLKIDGIEAMGTIFESFTMLYSGYDTDSESGTYEWHTLDFSGNSVIGYGTYSINEDATMITLIDNDGRDPSEMAIVIANDVLTLSGEYDGENFIYIADRQ